MHVYNKRNLIVQKYLNTEYISGFNMHVSIIIKINLGVHQTVSEPFHSLCFVFQVKG